VVDLLDDEVADADELEDDEVTLLDLLLIFLFVCLFVCLSVHNILGVRRKRAAE